LKPIETSLKGCYLINSTIHQDKRGSFVKTFHEDTFYDEGLETHFAEEYFSVSTQGVLRGMHFQIPPHDHSKLVYCVYGKVFDAVVDLRVSSSTYGKYDTTELDSETINVLYIPAGLAHGFYTISERAIMIYKVATMYSPEYDTGILWNSLEIPWPNENPIISDRDSQFIEFDQFKSPFN
tara:strand:+ start:1250 stop:1789 length:540 start_codon:yes stop_codon:yes gene_type:complete